MPLNVQYCWPHNSDYIFLIKRNPNYKSKQVSQSPGVFSLHPAFPHQSPFLSLSTCPRVFLVSVRSTAVSQFASLSLSLFLYTSLRGCSSPFLSLSTCLYSVSRTNPFIFRQPWYNLKRFVFYHMTHSCRFSPLHPDTLNSNTYRPLLVM